MSLIIPLQFVKATHNYVNYENSDGTDFRAPYHVIIKMWIPKSELQVTIEDMQGGHAFPEVIHVKIMDDADKGELAARCVIPAGPDNPAVHRDASGRLFVPPNPDHPERSSVPVDADTGRPYFAPGRAIVEDGDYPEQG